MEVVFTKYLEDKLSRLRVLGIARDVVVEAIENPDEVLKDVETGR